MKVIKLSARLWKAYQHQARLKAAKQLAEDKLRRKREQLIVEHMPQAAAIARQVWHRFTRAGQGGYGVKIDVADMISCAYIGLVEAAGRWDPSRGDFTKYCYLRVRGAVIDAHRRQAYIESQHASLDDWMEDLGDHQSEGRSLIGKYLSDPRPLPDAKAHESGLQLLVQSTIDRRLPTEQQDVLRRALAGARLQEIAEAHGQTTGWVRQQLTAARDVVGAEVQRRAA